MYYVCNISHVFCGGENGTSRRAEVKFDIVFWTTTPMCSFHFHPSQNAQHKSVECGYVA